MTVCVCRRAWLAGLRHGGGARLVGAEQRRLLHALVRRGAARARREHAAADQPEHHQREGQTDVPLSTSDSWHVLLFYFINVLF